MSDHDESTGTGSSTYRPRYSRSQRSPAVIKSGVVYCPIWLACAAGVLEQDGFAVRLVDAPAAGYDLRTVLDLVDDWQPQLVVWRPVPPASTTT